MLLTSPRVRGDDVDPDQFCLQSFLGRFRLHQPNGPSFIGTNLGHSTKLPPAGRLISSIVYVPLIIGTVVILKLINRSTIHLIDRAGVILGEIWN